MVELTSLSSKSGRASATFLKFYVSEDIPVRFSRGAKIYI